MKKIFLLTLTIACLGLAGLAQQKKGKSEGINGYWVIENSIKSPKQSVVYFYTAENQLVYKETVAGRKLNISRPKICRRLNAVLEQSLLAWKNNRAMKDDLQLVLRH